MEKEEKIICDVCGWGLRKVINKLYCENCGLIYDLDGNVIDIDTIKVKDYFENLLYSIKDDNRHFIKGLFFGYFETLTRSKWKKARQWALIKLIDLLKELKNEIE